LIVTRLTNQLDIAAIPADGTGKLHDIVASDALELNPALSPNGRWLAYSSGRSGKNEIWVQRYPDGTAVRLTNNGGYEPVWSADGRELFYRQGDAVMAVAVEAGDELSFGAPALLFSGPFVGLRRSESRTYDVARNGQFLMILPTEDSRPAASMTPATIVVVQNFGEELRQRVRPRRN
jgi:serine/threonine-protein kinase